MSHNDLLGDGDLDHDDYKTPAPDTIPVITSAMLDEQMAITPPASVDLRKVDALRTGVTVILGGDLSGHVRAGLRTRVITVCGQLTAGVAISDHGLIADATDLHRALKDLPGGDALQKQLAELVPIVQLK